MLHNMRVLVVGEHFFIISKMNKTSCFKSRHFINIYIINRTLHGRLEIRILSSRAESISILSALEDKIRIPTRPCNILYLPDINWDYQIAPGFDNISSLFCEIINDSFLLQMNQTPTRITNNTSNILDLLFTNQSERISDISTLESQISTDHLGVQFKISIIVKRERISPFVYNFKKADLQGLKLLSYLSFPHLGGTVASSWSGSSGPGSGPGQGHCVVFLGKTLYSHGASLHPGV